MATVDVKNLLNEHEGENLEFRSELKVSEGEDKDRDIKTLSAFLNTTGGMIVFGVKEEETVKKVVGVESAQTLESNLIGKIRAKLKPEEIPNIDFIPHSGKTLVVISVDRGNSPPYYHEGKVAYKRVGSNNFPLEKDEIAELLKRNSTTGDKKPVTTATIQDLDLELATDILSKRENKQIFVDDLEDLLFRTGLLIEHQGALKPSLAGILLFGKKTQDFLPCAKIKAEFKLETNSSEWDDILDCTGNIFEQIRQAEAFAKRNIKTSAKVVGFERVETTEIPTEAVREAIVNAVCHRDYSDEGTEVQFRIHGDTVKIESPGNLIAPITLNSILSNKFIPKTRNPIIADILVSLNFMDKRGTGFLRMINTTREAGLSAPNFEELANGFRVTFESTKVDKGEKFQGIAIDPKILSELNLSTDQKKILESIQKNGEVTTTEAMKAIGRSRPVTLKIISELQGNKVVVPSSKSKYDPNRKFSINTQILEKNLSTEGSDLSPESNGPQGSLF